MKSAKLATADAPSHRRSQPARQARTNSSRMTTNVARNPIVQHGDQPIDIFPAITHFADAMVSLPKDLVRHFTLLKEVDAKLYAPEEQLFQLVAATINAPLPEPRRNNGSSSNIVPTSAPMSAQNSSARGPPHAPSPDELTVATSGIFEPSNFPRRQLFRQTAFKIQEMLVSLEEKNHVLSTANDALQRQLARIEDVWPHLENEFSDEAKWGSTTHWAYPENRSGKQPERARRDGVAAISAAAQALAEEAAARSDARKQAVQAKKGMRNNQPDAEADAHDAPRTGKNHGKGRKPADNQVGLGIVGADPPSKKRKVEKVTNGGVAMERSISSAMSYAAAKAKGGSPTPGPEGPKKRKALPSGGGQSKKKTAISPSITSSPVVIAAPEPKSQARASPGPNTVPRPTTARARQNSLQSAARPPVLVNAKFGGLLPDTPEMADTSQTTRPENDVRLIKQSSAPARGDAGRKEAEKVESASIATPNTAKKEQKAEESDKSESLTPGPPPATVTTKSRRASKPSTPSLVAFPELSRSRSSRNADSVGNKKSTKKGGGGGQPLAPLSLDDDATSGDGDIDAEEPTYCYCNGVSYGEMVACDADECEREWFHLACVGLKVAPAEKSKWYCEDCKQRLHIGAKKTNGR